MDRSFPFSTIASSGQVGLLPFGNAPSHGGIGGWIEIQKGDGGIACGGREGIAGIIRALAIDLDQLFSDRIIGSGGLPVKTGEESVGFPV